MDAHSRIKRSIQEMMQQGITAPFCAAVKAVGTETCTVEYDGLELEARLSAALTTSKNYFRVYPKAGSTVLVASLTGQLDSLAVLTVNEAERITFVQGGQTVEINGETGKMQIKNGEVSLLSLFDSLADFIGNLTVVTPMGNSTEVVYPPPPLLEQFKQDAEKILY